MIKRNYAWIALGLAATSAIALKVANALDENSDGISDVYAAHHGLEPGSGDEDPDGDGQSNRVESAWGTDPHDPNSKQVTSFGEAGNLHDFSLPTKEGKRYVFQGQSDLNQAGWIDIDLPFTGTGGVEHLLLDLPLAGAGEFFWRVDTRGEVDADGDGLGAFEEGLLGTSDESTDSDGDEWTDLQEFSWGWDPNNDQSLDDRKFSKYGDYDEDGTSNASEILNNTNPSDSDDHPTGAQKPEYTLINLGQNYFPLQVGNDGHVFMLNEGEGLYYRRWFWGEKLDLERFSEHWSEGNPFMPGYSLKSMNNRGEIGGSYVSAPPEEVAVPTTCGSSPYVSSIMKRNVEPIIIQADGTRNEMPRPALSVTYSSDSEFHEIIALNDSGDYVVSSLGSSPVTDGISTAKATFPELRIYSSGTYGSNLHSVSMRGIIPLTGSCDGAAQYTGEYLSLRFFNNQGKTAGTGLESDEWESFPDLRGGDVFYFENTSNNKIIYNPSDMNHNGWIAGQENSLYSLHINTVQHELPSVLDGGISLSTPDQNEPLVIASGNHLALQKREIDSGNLLPFSQGSAAYFVRHAEEVLHEPDENGPTKNQEWSDLTLLNVSDNGNLLIGHATMNGLSHAVLLLKMDVSAHSPTELINDGELQKGAVIPAEDEDTASNLQFVVNNDNDFHSGYSATYPKDMDRADNFHQREDDLVAVKLEFPANIDTGTLEISANVDSSNPEARAYVITSGGMFPPTKELVTLSPATSVDLSSASNTDLLWELADKGEQTLYIEGLSAKDDLEVKLSFKVDGTEMASESVHMQLLPSTERPLQVLTYPGMGQRAMVHMNNSDNVLREDHDGYQGTADRVTPIAFRQNGATSSQGVETSWRTVNSSNSFQVNAIYDELLRQEKNVYICEDIYPAAGQARLGEEVMILGKVWTKSQIGGTPKNILAHEWLHAFSSHNHVNETDDIMWGTRPLPEGVESEDGMVERGHGGNVNEHQYNHFIN